MLIEMYVYKPTENIEYESALEIVEETDDAFEEVEIIEVTGETFEPIEVTVAIKSVEDISQLPILPPRISKRGRPKGE